MDKTQEERDGLPERWRSALEAQLDAGESVLAWVEPNLEGTPLRYAEGLVVLTDRRVLCVAGPEAQAGGRAWTSWPLAEVAGLRARDRAGLGTLELMGTSERLASWRYTNSRAPSVHRLLLRYESLGRSARGEVDSPTEVACPSCGAILPDDHAACPSCSPALVPPPRSSVLRVLRSVRSDSPLIRLVKFARNRMGMVSLGIGLTLLSTAASLVWPYLTASLLDDVLIPFQDSRGSANPKPVDTWLVGAYLLGLAGSAALAWAFSWWRTFVLAWVSERVSADLRTRTYEHLQRLSLEFFGGKRTGDLMARLSTDTDRICNFLSVNLIDFATDVVTIGGTAIVLVIMSPSLAAATIIPLPVIAWLVFWVRDRLRRGFQRGNRAWAEMTSVLADTIPGIRVVKAFAQEKREVERFRESNDRVLHANDRVNQVWSFFGPMVTWLTQTGLLIVWAFGIFLIFRGHIKVGVLTAFLTYMSRIYIRLESMSRMVQATQRASTSAQRIFEILDRVPSVAEPVRPVHIGRPRGQLELRGVGFRYGNRAVVQDVSLTIQPGEMIGLVGPSGAGKSTLVNLVCRFYDVSEGSILVDGIDIRSFSVNEYRRHIGIVLQEPFLFFGTVAENIAYGRPDASRTEVVAAARAARAHEFILRLPDGYDSIVGERGQALSGGERQRISIARALLIDPRILILDEATSSVDTETEREIQEALDNLIMGRTTIAIAHRLSTLRKADRLVVLERGQIAEVGHHLELLGRQGAYARLHKAQAELMQGILN
ncbi:MAG TPA: ABC transporter transmembrane domain-containing protein [Isosphaeraceae bacterium]|nr:ABC transporter transmembrane domain-containing protein [Isosphaeraceae bacterium]